MELRGCPLHDLGVAVEKCWIQPHLVPLNYLEYRPVPGGFVFKNTLVLEIPRRIPRAPRPRIRPVAPTSGLLGMLWPI